MRIVKNYYIKKKKKRNQLPGLKKSEGNKKKLHGHFFKCHKNLVKQPSI